jgi:RimJ/RimL family protein N-acetyltransferase
MNLILQRAVEEDAPSIIRARDQSFYDDYIRFGECPGYHNTPEIMRDTIRKADVYRILVDGKMAGDVSVHQPSENGSQWIGCLEIIPEYQNGGIGFETLRAVFERYPETKRWELETPVQNKRNCHFYEKAGFRGTKETVHSDLLTIRTYVYEIAKP